MFHPQVHLLVHGFAALLLGSAVSHAATFSGSDVLITVNSSGGTGGTSSNASTLNTTVGVSEDLIATSGPNQIDVGDAAANGSSLSITNPAGNLYSFSAVMDAASGASVNRTSNSGSGITDASADVSYQLTFTLDPGESGDLIFAMNYSLTESLADGTLAWSLTGPSGSIAAVTGNVGTAGNTAESLLNQDVNQTAALTESGTYTLTISAAVPDADFVNSSGATFVDINSLSLQFNGIPEPGSVTLLALALIPSLLRRGRRA